MECEGISVSMYVCMNALGAVCVRELDVKVQKPELGPSLGAQCS